jgi:hypothetical protein
VSGRDRVSRARSRLCRETSRMPARARQSQNVPVSYPRSGKILPGAGNTIDSFAGIFFKPSDGLEPSTPSLPWRFRDGTGGHGRALAITFFLQIEPSRRVSRARACPRVAKLMYPSRTRAALSVQQTKSFGTSERLDLFLRARRGGGQAASPWGLANSYWSAFRTLSRAARRAGQAAETTPAVSSRYLYLRGARTGPPA